MDILIIKLGAIGDVIRTTAILLGLMEKYKNCTIDWVTKKESFDILKNTKKSAKQISGVPEIQGISEHNNLISNIFFIDNNVKNKLKNKNYDLLINLDDDFDACNLAMEINSKKIIGAYLKNGKRLYTEDSSSWFDIGLISKFGKQKADELKAKNKKTYQEIMYNILDLDYKKQEPILILNGDKLNFGKNFANKNNISNDDLVIGINTGAGGRWQDKKLSTEKTIELIDKLNNEIKNIKLLLFGGPEEIERNEKIKRSVKTNIIDAGCNNSLMEFAALVNLCKILVVSDSLALNIGVALKKKIVAFFAPTSPNEIELYSKGIKIIPKKGCICCYKPKCDIPPEWGIDEFVDAIKKLLNSNN